MAISGLISSPQAQTFDLLRIGEDGDARDFGASTGGGRNGDDRQAVLRQRRRSQLVGFCGFAGYRASGGEFRRVQRRAAANADHRLAPVSAASARRGIDVGCLWLALEAVIEQLIASALRRAFAMSRRDAQRP